MSHAKLTGKEVASIPIQDVDAPEIRYEVVQLAQPLPPLPPEPEDMLTMNDVMTRLSIGRTTLRQLIDYDPDFMTVKVGERRLMSVASYRRFVRAKESKEREAKPYLS